MTPSPEKLASPLAQCLAALTQVADSAEIDEGERLAQSTVHLKRLIATDDWLDEAFAEPHPDFYRQYLLHCDPLLRFSVVSFVWGPGQQTPIHDHTVWGLIGVLRGAEISKSFEVRLGRLTALEETLHERGQVTAVSPTVGDIHQVRNAYDDRVSISIHIYGADIGQTERHVYSPDGVAKRFVSGYSNRYLPNVWGRP